MSETTIPHPKSVTDLTADRVNGQIAKKVDEYHQLGKPVKHASKEVYTFPDAKHTQYELATVFSEGNATHQDFYRSYKNTPHSPISLAAKYVVHRTNNADLYDDASHAERLDHEFLTLHKKGNAAQKNGHITPYDLHLILGNNPKAVAGMIKHREELQNQIKRGCGLSVREIHGEPHVALTRGLNTPYFGEEHALSSFSDKENSGFGTYQHHVWVPLKDIWFTFMAGSRYTRGQFGHESEVLAANTAPRYAANTEDVKQSRFKDFDADLYKDELRSSWIPAILDDATPEEFAGAVRHAQVLPKIIQHLEKHPDKITPDVWERIKPFSEPSIFLNTKVVPEELAMKWLGDDVPDDEKSTPARWRAISNPNLTPESLIKVTQSKWWNDTAKRNWAIVDRVFDHPNYNDDVGKALLYHSLQNIQSGNAGSATPVLSRLLGAKNPPKQLGAAIIAGLHDAKHWASDVISNSSPNQKNEVINSDFTDKLFEIADDKSDFPPLVSYRKPNLAEKLPLSDTLLSEIISKGGASLDPGLGWSALNQILGQNKFLTERQIQTMVNNKKLQPAVWHQAATGNEYAMKAILQSEHPQEALQSILEYGVNYNLTDSDLVKLGQLMKKDKNPARTHQRVIAILDPSLDQNGPMLDRLKNLCERPQDVDDYVKKLHDMYDGRHADILAPAPVTQSIDDNEFVYRLGRMIYEHKRNSGTKEHHKILPLPAQV